MLDPRVDTFLTVCRTMNFTHAAQLLHLTQPAVSQHIHTLEEEFGAKFFRYENRQLSFTESGKLFRRAAAAMRHDALLLEEAELAGTDALRITHERLANHLGSVREVVSRMLKYFEGEGLVKLTRGGVELLDRPRLKVLSTGSQR